MDVNEMINLMQTEASPEERMKMLMQMMAVNQEKQENPDQETDYEKVKKHIEYLGRHIKRLKQAEHMLLENIEILMHRNDQLAEALGACRDCFGQDLHCAACHGKGTPGYYDVNERLFLMYIQPCIAKANNHATYVKQNKKEVNHELF